MTRVYADYAASTPTEQAVVAAMRPFFNEDFGNPSSTHSFGRSAFEAVETARAKVANFINAKAEEIYFTATGTEANNLAILGVAKANRRIGTHVVTTQIEHPSVLNACAALVRDGLAVTYVNPLKNGHLTPEAVAKAITASTILLTIHLANSEVGVIQDVAAIAAAAKKKNPQILIHADACQATSLLKLDVKELNVDMMTINGSKAYGPKGVAVLFVRDGSAIFPLIYGGGQEQSLRSGTENVPGIVGLAEAVSIIAENRHQEASRLAQLRNGLQEELLHHPGVIVNCASSNRLPNHLSLTLSKSSSTDLVRDLDRKGVAVSAGSACSSKSLSESHVLLSLGMRPEEANKTIRVSLGRQTTKQDCDLIAAKIAEIAG